METVEKMISIKELNDIATQVRRDILRMVNGASSGHPGGSLSITDYLVALYFGVMDHTPEPFDMDGIGQDLFFLSNGHTSPAFYSVLARSGYFPVSELATFRKIHSRLQGHPATMEGLPGVRVASGSLGQGLSVAVGAALSKKLNHDEKTVYCLMGDGELDEGQIWEAAAYAGAKKVERLIAAVDYNHKQIDGDTDDVLPLLDLKAKFSAFGWQVLETDGHDMNSLLDTLSKAKEMTGKGAPVMILLHTVMGKGVDFMENKHQWHGVAPDDDQLKAALAQLPETLGDY
jgi:transketolase